MGIIIYIMKQNNQRTAVMVLIGAITFSEYVEAIKLPPSKLPEMYSDPEYANTWRYTNEERYVNSTQWEDDVPAGYKDEKSFVQVPDYGSYDYSGSKHWEYANDKFYSDPQEWIKSSPKGYDD